MLVGRLQQLQVHASVLQLPHFPRSPGLRWTTTQILLQGRSTHEALGGPLEVLEALTPTMFATTGILAVSTENVIHLDDSPYFSTAGHSAATLGAIALTGLVAFMMIWVEFRVIKETSALTFMIAGTFKEIVTVVSAVIIF